MPGGQLKPLAPFRVGEFMPAPDVEAMRREIMRLGNVYSDGGISLISGPGGNTLSLDRDRVKLRPMQSEIDPNDSSKIIVGRFREDAGYPFDDEIRLHVGGKGDETDPRPSVERVSITEVDTKVFYQINYDAVDNVLTVELKAETEEPNPKPTQWVCVLGVVKGFDTTNTLITLYEAALEGNIKLDYYAPAVGGTTVKIPELVGKTYDDGTRDCYVGVEISGGIISVWPEPTRVTEGSPGAEPPPLEEAPVVPTVTGDENVHAECFEICASGAGDDAFNGTYRQFGGPGGFSIDDGTVHRIILDTDLNQGAGQTQDRYFIIDSGAEVYQSANFPLETTPCPTSLAFFTLAEQAHRAPPPLFIAGVCPIDLIPPQVAGLVQWLKAEDITVGDGNPVVTWPDASGSGNSVTQSIAGSRPIFRATGFNGNPSVEFDGVDDYFTATSMISEITGAANPFTVIFVIDADGPGVLYSFGKAVLVGSNPFIQLLLEGVGITGSAHARRNDDESEEDSVGNSAGTGLNVISFRYDGSEIQIKVLSGPFNRNVFVTAADLVTDINRAAIGAFLRVTASSFYDGDIGELAFYSNAIPGDKENALMSGFQTKFS